jgi:hypothetical protein
VLPQLFLREALINFERQEVTRRISRIIIISNTFNMMISSNRQTFHATVTFAALMITLVECSGRTSQYRPGQTKDEEDMERYRKPFFIIISALLLSVTPVLCRFVYSLFTDPIVPMLWKEMNARGKAMLVHRFGNLGQHRFEAEGWR